jgi:hypothetical protein
MPRAGQLKYSNEQLRRELIRVSKELGRDFVKCDDPIRISFSTYINRYGSWKATNLAAGLKPLECGEQRKPKVKKGERKPIVRRFKNPRRHLSAELRLKLLKRDRFRCALCGRSPANDEVFELHFDHIKPLVLGGRATDENNIWVLCDRCNYGKHERYEPAEYWFAAWYLAVRTCEGLPNYAGSIATKDEIMKKRDEFAKRNYLFNPTEEGPIKEVFIKDDAPEPAATPNAATK